MGIPKLNQSPDNLVSQVSRGEKIMPECMMYYISDPPDDLSRDGLCQNCLNHTFCVWAATNKIFCEHYQ